ncbi:hypothetical protein NDU88_002253 [Pleurodeles waltl]|uniref:Uncharacterized protein n=1 Tax=Pleurodeles waltl TaxID=8319 RepID=A0AAV7UZ94_PLEWA|nr:hypothetical protein NDU88_002253 [Pleurodeles waltl]
MGGTPRQRGQLNTQCSRGFQVKRSVSANIVNRCPVMVRFWPLSAARMGHSFRQDHRPVSDLSASRAQMPSSMPECRCEQGVKLAACG